ncbi:MAG: ABC transporter ATP-binding protein [bacterium]|nr:ABC transporter ATP-binding protein [bacterium]
MNIAIELQQLSYRYRNAATNAIDGVTLEIPVGCCFGLLGPNGAGKTTLMRLLCGSLTPTSGTIHYATESHERIGVVPQEIALYEELSAIENLRFWGRLQGVASSELSERCDSLLRTVGLLERQLDIVKKFSGGMKRRLNFACGIIHQPKLVLLDEPTAGVDPQSRAHLLTLVEQLVESGTTVLYSTHYMEEVERLCSRMAIIDQGKLLEEGSQEEILAQYPLPMKMILHTNHPEQAKQVSLASKVTECGAVTLAGERVEVLLTVPVNEAIQKIGKLPFDSLEIRKPSLESLFLHLTGRGLRE